jgi:hypothetical protein
MANSRKIYDEKAYEYNVLESTEPGKYSLLSDATYNNQTCFQNAPEIHSGIGQYRISDNNDMINAESDLYNLNRKDSNDPKSQYPYIKHDYKQPILQKCEKSDLSRNYPSLEAPIYKRGQNINRFEELCLDPQALSRINSNNYIGLNTRLYSRDNFKVKNPVLKEEQGLPEEKPFESPMVEFYANCGGREDFSAEISGCGCN